MDTEKIFAALEIEMTKDEAAIKAAYRAKLTSVNPEDNPEGFKRLREAYEAALKYAAQEEETSPKEADDPVSLYLKRLDQVYRCLPRRLDAAEWNALLHDELLDDLDLCEDAKWGIFRYLADNYELPADIWHLLDETFHIERDQEQFKEHLPVNFVNYLLWSCSEDARSTAFPFHRLKGPDTADYDEFIHQLNALCALAGKKEEYEDRDAWLKEQAQKIAYLDTLNISHPYFNLEKARYALETGHKDTALQSADALLADGTKDARLLLGCARIYRLCDREALAERIYREFLQQDEDQGDSASGQRRHSPGDLYGANAALSEILLRQKKYKEAREHALRARKLYHTPVAQQLVTDCSNAIIEQMTGTEASDAKRSTAEEPAAANDTTERESAAESEFSIEDALLLADCYVMAHRASEGAAYFDAHPALKEDSARCHRAKALLYRYDRYEEALTETLCWRKFLEADPNTNPAETVQSYILDANLHELIFSDAKDKQAPEALNHKAAGFAAFDAAFQLTPDSIDLRVSKFLFLKVLWQTEASKDYYRQAADLCEEMIERDPEYFWAYCYAQEAYEGLRDAQKVIDYFYAARRIYAGLPDIYERAADVFDSYEQWKDLRHILQLAEEAGVESAALKVMRLKLLREEAKAEQELLDAEAYAKSLTAELEETLQKEAAAENDTGKLKRQLAEAYRQRALLHDNNDSLKDFKNLDDIEKWVLRSVELSDEFSNRYFLGFFYLYEKVNYEEAYRHLKVCEEKGTSHWVYRRIARCHEHWKQWDDAIRYYKLAAESAPDNNDYLWRIGWLYRTKYTRTGQQEYYDEAIKYLDLQMERFGGQPDKNWEIWWQYSSLHARIGEYGKALEEIDRALEENQTDSKYLGHKADILSLTGRSEEALAVYEAGIECARQEKEDYAYGYTQIYNYYRRSRAYREGLAWFEARQAQLLTEDQRAANLDRIITFCLLLGNRPKALELLEQKYTSVSLRRHTNSSWSREGDRINDLLDAYQYFLSGRELRKKAEEAAKLLKRDEGMEAADGPNAKKEAAEGKCKAYNQIGLCYAHYLADDKKALFYFQKALEYAKTAAAHDADSNDDYRDVINNIMKCLWRLGRTKEAVPYRKFYLDDIAKDYEECRALGKSLEELLQGGRNRRHHCYQLFRLAFFCGEYEEAERRLQQMGTSPWCAFCKTKDCTEFWECQGYMALIRGETEKAAGYFRQAMDCAGIRNCDAECELRRLRKLP